MVIKTKIWWKNKCNSPVIQLFAPLHMCQRFHHDDWKVHPLNLCVEWCQWRKPLRKVNYNLNQEVKGPNPVSVKSQTYLWKVHLKPHQKLFLSSLTFCLSTHIQCLSFNSLQKYLPSWKSFIKLLTFPRLMSPFLPFHKAKKLLLILTKYL